jgi:cold shock protein
MLILRSSVPASVHPAPTGLPSRRVGYIQTSCHNVRLYGFREISMAPMNGTIKRLVSDKGFGFILASDGNEYFFHNSACKESRFDDLREGQAVTFERGQGPKGPRGENVKVV